MTKLPNKWTPILMKIPESGMGYSNVRVVLKDGTIHECTAVNCQYLSGDIAFPLDQIENILTLRI